MNLLVNIDVDDLEKAHWTPVHLDFVVPDIDAALARAKAAGGHP